MFANTHTPPPAPRTGLTAALVLLAAGVFCHVSGWYGADDVPDGTTCHCSPQETGGTTDV